MVTEPKSPLSIHGQVTHTLVRFTRVERKLGTLSCSLDCPALSSCCGHWPTLWFQKPQLPDLQSFPLCSLSCVCCKLNLYLSKTETAFPSPKPGPSAQTYLPQELWYQAGHVPFLVLQNCSSGTLMPHPRGQPLVVPIASSCCSYLIAKSCLTLLGPHEL